MERLTKYDELGNVELVGTSIISELRLKIGLEDYAKLTKALLKLSEYEDIDGDPNDIN